MKKFIKVTIDGPSASGKSTVAKGLSKKLGFTHLDTGAIYRAIALYYRNNKLLSVSEEKQEEELSLFSYHFIGDGKKRRHFIGAEDVTEEIRSREIAHISSQLSTKVFIRDYATRLQRVFAEGENIVVEGRDTGSVVFPDADIKIFLEADVEERAKRRYISLKKKPGHQELTLEDVITDLTNRDERDMTREQSPLICPKNAIRVDTTELGVNDIVKPLSLIVEKYPHATPAHRKYWCSYKGKKCSAFYFPVKWFFSAYFKVFHRFKVEGLENFTVNSPGIIACNHVSFMDPPMLGCGSPQIIHALARKSLFKSKIMAFFMSKLNTYPVSGTSDDKPIIKKVVSLLLKGEKVLIFPEGTRSKDGKVQALRQGLSLFADKGNAEVIPAAVVGPEKALAKGKLLPKLFTPVKLIFGPPVSYRKILKEIGDKKEARDLFLKTVQKEIQTLIDTHRKP
jgi:cytidylate kinase